MGELEKQISFSGPTEASTITLDTNVAPTDQVLSNKQRDSSSLLPSEYCTERANVFSGQK